MEIDGVEVRCAVEGVSDEELMEYVRHVKATARKDGEEVRRLDVSPSEGGGVALDYMAKPPAFQRIRRITGYLVGTTDRWNNAKRAELKDRVKHGLNLKGGGSREAQG